MSTVDEPETWDEIDASRARAEQNAAEQAAGEQDPAKAAAGAAPPVALFEGTFAIYPDGQGGYVLVTDTAEHGTDRRHIPAAMVKLATGGGIIGRRLAGLFGGAPGGD